MWKPLIAKGSTSAAKKLHAAQLAVTLAPRAKEASMVGRTGLPGTALALNSDTAIYAGPGNIAAGHCLLRFGPGVGLCTISDGTGTLAGFSARVRVTHDKSIPTLWHWDGTYSFNKG